MILVCFRPHWWERPDTGIVCETLVDFIFHHITAHSPLWLKAWLVDTGFLDAPGEGCVLFWRWDFWNATLAALYRADDQRRWEAKRDRTRARWGETSA